MDRRAALKLLGAIIVFLGGRSVRAEEIGTVKLDRPSWLEEASFQFDEAGLKDIVIIRKNKKKIKIPFSEVVDALKEPAIDWRPVVSMDGGRYPFIRFQSLEIGARSDGVVVWRKKPD